MIFKFEVKIHLLLQLILQILNSSNLLNQFAITVFFNFQWSSVFKWFSVSVQCFSSVFSYMKGKLFSCFLYFIIIQFKLVFSYPQCVLYLKSISKTYQFIYYFNSSFLAVGVIVTYTFPLTRKIIYLFILFIVFILFQFEHFGCTNCRIINKNPVVHTLFYNHTLCDL